MAVFRDEFTELLTAPSARWVWLVSSILTTVAGPFGTYDAMSITVRLVFWPSLIAVSLLFSYVVCAALTTLLPKMGDWVHDLIAVILFSILFTPVVSQALTLSVSDTMPYLSLWLEVFSITACIAFVQRLVQINWPKAEPSPKADDDPAEEPAQSRLLRRLDGAEAADILRMTVQDHYVEVVLLGKPSQRILMRFGDAVDEAEDLMGFCVHRSHWVVRSLILGVVTENGREMVEMIDGSRVPVSRTYRPNLIDAGLISSQPDRAAG